MPPTTPESKDQGRRHGLIDSSVWFLLALCVASGGASVWLNGWGSLAASVGMFVGDLTKILPQLLLGIVVGVLFTLLVPRQIVARFLGRQAGAKGVALACFLGVVMPGGPFASFPLVYALGRSGAGTGALIAFLAAWAMVGFQRLLIWEIPFMGAEFALLRFIVSLPLPVIAGLVASRLEERFAVFNDGRFSQ